MNVDDFLKHLDKSLFLTKGCKSIMSGGSDSSITMSIGGAETDDNQDANPDTTQDNNNIEGFAKADDTAKKQINESAEREASGKQDAKDKITNVNLSFIAKIWFSVVGFGSAAAVKIAKII